MDDTQEWPIWVLNNDWPYWREKSPENCMKNQNLKYGFCMNEAFQRAFRDLRLQIDVVFLTESTRNLKNINLQEEQLLMKEFVGHLFPISLFFVGSDTK